MREQAKLIAQGLWEANQELAEEVAHEIYELRDEESDEQLFSDWRLPTIEELITLVDYSTSKPASFDKSISSSGCWSSTIREGYKDVAWGVGFDYGVVNGYYKHDNRYVRCVRAGENGLEWSADTENRMSWYQAIEYAKNLKAPVAFRKETNDN